MTKEQVLSNHIQEYLDSGMWQYEACYLNKDDLKVIIKALELKSCKDCISRQGAIDLIADYEFYELNMGQVAKGIRDLPSVTPQPKTGHWIDTGSGQECSECGEIQYGYDNFRFYCAKCGSKNVIESEDGK